ncbi:Substrate-specific component BioY of biotin ECF transporter [Ochrobactrum soli]|uniref:Biotin transporter n=1 Tax=Ochrobactrum soli TaxID=2448455 RepID=A0A2P9HFD4_9HYPH|nr:Substrate-specific component BioY of biotin ECF transporter [[Ochrobactrum] soli]
MALFAALICALGFLPAVTLGFGVPITAQNLGVMLAGAVLGPKRGVAAVALVILLVAIGLPVLAVGRGGLGVFAGPTVGFLLGWIPAVYVTGLFIERAPITNLGVSTFLGAVLGCIGVLYLFGAIGMSLILAKPFLEAVKLLAIFIPGDLVKAVITGVLVSALAKIRPQDIHRGQTIR